MNRVAAIRIGQSVRKRIHQGDTPTEPQHHREVVEEALVELLNIVELSRPYLHKIGFEMRGELGDALSAEDGESQ